VLANVASANATFTPTVRTDVTNPAACTPGACYVLRLAVSDRFATVTDDVAVTSVNGPPVADARQLASGVSDVNVLDGSSSSEPDGDAITSYLWTQLDGADVTGGTGRLEGITPSFTASTADVYLFQHVVSDGAAESVGDLVAIVVTRVNAPPNVVAGAAVVRAVVGENSPLSATASDPDGDTATIEWHRRTPAVGFPVTLLGPAPTLQAPSLRALLLERGDNEIVYELTAVDARGARSNAVSVTLRVQPRDEHVIVSTTGTDAAGCGAPSNRCRSLARGLAEAAAQLKDVIVTVGRYEEVLPTNQFGHVPLKLPPGVNVFGGRDPIDFRQRLRSTIQLRYVDPGNEPPPDAMGIVAGPDVDGVVVTGIVVVDDASDFFTATTLLECIDCTMTLRDVGFEFGAYPEGRPPSRPCTRHCPSGTLASCSWSTASSTPARSACRGRCARLVHRSRCATSPSTSSNGRLRSSATRSAAPPRTGVRFRLCSRATPTSRGAASRCALTRRWSCRRTRA